MKLESSQQIFEKYSNTKIHENPFSGSPFIPFRRTEGRTKDRHGETWYFSGHATWIDYILITNLMHWLLFIHKILFSSTCFEPQILIFSRIEWELTQAVYRQATRNSHREWQYHRLRVYNCILLKMSTWGSKHVEENSILWINNNQCIKLVINIYSQDMAKLTVALRNFTKAPKNSTFCPHSVLLFCMDRRIKSDYFPAQH